MNHHKDGGCSLGEKHSGPCEWGKPVRQTSNEPARLDKNSNRPLDKDSNILITELRARIAELEQRVVDLQQPFDKTEYQREYMRKRRMSN